MPQIVINGITLDPQAEAPALAAANLQKADATDSDYILVQTKAPLNKEQKAQLAAKGATILEYVPEDTYICHYKPTNLNELRALPFVSWANVYLAGFKVTPELADLPSDRAMHKLTTMSYRFQNEHSREPKVVDVVLHRNIDAETIRKKIADAARVDPDTIKVNGNKVRLTLPVRRFKQLVDLDEVRHIEEVVARKLNNNVARGILRVEISNPGDATLEGEGQIVAIADTGFDKGSSSNVHPAFAGRVIKLYALGRQKANDPDGHGTHVAGSVLADGQSQALGVSIRGTAPKARLVLQSVLDSQGGLGGLPDDLHDLFRTPYEDDHARIHTNSWGSTRGDGRYDANARELDDFVWNNRDLVVCFAAGNEGSDSDGDGKIDPISVTPPGTAKNCITIGATENNRPSKTLTYGQGWPTDFPANPIADDAVADNAEGMVAFSSRGPTRDQRIKPDVVAPGTFILSTRSRDTKSQGWELTNDPLYFFEGGTSMATPLVAGCVALVREHFIKRLNIQNPSAALVKAMIINGAHPVRGQYVPTEVGLAPNDQEGFGRVDIESTIGPYPANTTVEVKDEATGLDTGAEERTTVTIPNEASLLKVTLVWTDLPGETLQNDLDLIVRDSNGNEHHGNAPASSAEFDRVNNVEQVTWAGIAAGQAEVIVRAHRVTQSVQPYALVIRVA